LRYNAKSLTLWKALFNLEFLVGISKASDGSTGTEPEASVVLKIMVAILKRITESAVNAMHKYVPEESVEERKKLQLEVEDAFESILISYEKSDDEFQAELAKTIRANIFNS
jgi:hypothetical protein